MPHGELLRSHDLGRTFDCFFKHAGRNSSPDLRRTVCTLSSTAMVDSCKKIPETKKQTQVSDYQYAVKEIISGCS